MAFTVTAGCCKKKTKYSFQFEKSSDFSMLVCKNQSERADRNTPLSSFCCNSFLWLTLPFLIPSFYFYLLPFNQPFPHLSISTHLSTSSFLFFPSVMTHRTCPDCGVPSICKHGIFWAGGEKMAAIRKE